ncbi:hypothetical protein L228DRAFT_115131 [Xylona heveae TC161]|uniref:Uncharacterized protein n=1 Tax=Xylona heveae (strain CBS 132557 / TC161) TaxID=1328760 RepID=A0A165HEC3_XYLHT|nr:hypothetical protein L228DRAFT_115131 [Xylona heveae TC161]KZF23382.1 hypothetical protein L228DRAFT_115131 [Xylona heveae TC161]
MRRDRLHILRDLIDSDQVRPAGLRGCRMNTKRPAIWKAHWRSVADGIGNTASTSTLLHRSLLAAWLQILDPPSGGFNRHAATVCGAYRRTWFFVKLVRSDAPGPGPCSAHTSCPELQSLICVASWRKPKCRAPYLSICRWKDAAPSSPFKTSVETQQSTLSRPSNHCTHAHEEYAMDCAAKHCNPKRSEDQGKQRLA